MATRSAEVPQSHTEREPKIVVPHIVLVGSKADLYRLDRSPSMAMRLFSIFPLLLEEFNTTAITLHIPQRMNGNDYLAAEGMIINARPAIENMQVLWKGDTSHLPPRLTETLEDYFAPDPTVYPPQTLALSIGQGGRQEMIDGIKRMIAAGAQLPKQTPYSNEEIRKEEALVASFLASGRLPDVDLVVLTGQKPDPEGTTYGIFSLRDLGFKAAYAEYVKTRLPLSGLSIDSLTQLITQYGKRERPQGGDRKKY